MLKMSKMTKKQVDLIYRVAHFNNDVIGLQELLVTYPSMYEAVNNSINSILRKRETLNKELIKVGLPTLKEI